jgi:hypothetical protein
VYLRVVELSAVAADGDRQHVAQRHVCALDSRAIQVGGAEGMLDAGLPRCRQDGRVLPTHRHCRIWGSRGIPRDSSSGSRNASRRLGARTGRRAIQVGVEILKVLDVEDLNLGHRTEAGMVLDVLLEGDVSGPLHLNRHEHRGEVSALNADRVDEVRVDVGPGGEDDALAVPVLHGVVADGDGDGDGDEGFMLELEPVGRLGVVF